MKQKHRTDNDARRYLLPLLLTVALVAGRLFLPALAADIYRPAKVYRAAGISPSERVTRGVPHPEAREEVWEREMLTLADEARRSPGSSFRRRHLEGGERVEAQLSAPPEELLRILHRLSEVGALRRFSITPKEKELYTLYLEAEQ